MAYKNYESWKTIPNSGDILLSIVIPAYNEEIRILPTIGAITSYVCDLGIGWELIVADDGSKDKTVEIVEEQKFANVQILKASKNAGKGNAVHRGMLAARGRYILFADADNSTPIEEISKLLTKVQQEGYDIAVGSRAATGAEEGHKSFLRHLLETVLITFGEYWTLYTASTFLCSPWITELAEIGPLGLSLSDFAVHDPISDYLLLLQSKHAALQDTKRLAQKVTTKQEILRDTNDKLHQEISERIRIEAALAQARDQALASSRLKSEFLATMSHELRTPMNGIMGMGELLLDTALDNEQRDYANVIYQEAEILLGLLNDILDFSKIEAGKLILEESEFTLATLIDSVTSLLRPKAKEKGLAFIAFIAADLPKRLIGDATRLRQIIVNLVSNAIKFTEQGEVVVEIKRANHQPHHLRQPAIKNVIPIQIVVRDTGIGIAQAMQTRLFASFVQADSSTTRKYGGTGLGLAITKRLVELMQGSIAVHSELGKGSVFTTTLRLLRCENEPESAIDEQWRNLRTLLVSADHEQIDTIILHSLPPVSSLGCNPAKCRLYPFNG